MRRRVLLLTRDLIPLPGLPVSGGGLRAWGIGEALRARGHEVIYSMPRRAIPAGEEHAELRRHAFETIDLHSTILRAEPDVLFVEQWGLATYIQDVSLPLVLDLHGSLILENAFRRHRSLTSNAAAKIKALNKADLLLCPGQRQRAYFMAWMMMAGADPLDLPIEVVPVSLPPEMPPRPAPGTGPLSVVYGGQLWPWIDSGDALLATARVLQASGGTLRLFVTAPSSQDLLPYDGSSQVLTTPLPEELLASPAVVLEGTIAHQELLAAYCGADLALDVYARNAERDLAFTTRTVEYLWCGLPVIHASFSELAGLIEAYEAGWTVAPDDPEAIRRCLELALSDRDELRRRSENARRLVREHMAWDRTIDPLDRFIRDPAVREKGSTIFGRLSLEFDRIAGEAQARIQTLEAERQGAQGELAALRAGLARAEVRAAEEPLGTEEAAERLGAIRGRLEEQLAEQSLRLAASERSRRALEERLELEVRDHAQTAARFEEARSELAKSQRTRKDLERENAVLRADLKGAAAKIVAQAEELQRQIDHLNAELLCRSDLELTLNRDLAERAAVAGELNRQLTQAQAEVSQLKSFVQANQEQVRRIQEEPIQRTMATGQHVWQRLVHQVPTVTSLWLGSMATNLYLNVWQRIHHKRIFPGG